MSEDQEEGRRRERKRKERKRKEKKKKTEERGERASPQLVHHHQLLLSTTGALHHDSTAVAYTIAVTTSLTPFLSLSLATYHTLLLTGTTGQSAPDSSRRRRTDPVDYSSSDDTCG